MRTFAKIFFTLLILSCVLISCSSAEETQVKKQQVETDTVYIFDEIPSEEVFEFEAPVQHSFEVYVIQIGAFSTFDRAKEFADKSWVKLGREIKVEYEQTKNLYVVLIYPPFKDKSKAVGYRNEIQKSGEFKDAWIVTVETKK